MNKRIAVITITLKSEQKLIGTGEYADLDDECTWPRDVPFEVTRILRSLKSSNSAETRVVDDGNGYEYHIALL